MRALAILLTVCPLVCGGARCEGAPRAMVVAADRLAADAGLQILRTGGSAADAAVAVLMVLGVVEPQTSGVGGGAVLMYFDATTGRVSAWDGRETAPAAVSGSPEEQRAGGGAVGVPGAVRMLEALHRQHGRAPWPSLLAPAISLAEQGAPVSPGLAQAIAVAQDALRQQKLALSVFFSADGLPLPAGATFTNPALAQTLRAIAAGGANALLRGAIAAEIATAIRNDPRAGLMTTDDMAAYTPREREALCALYRGHSVCTPPPPAGGLVLLHMLMLLDGAGLAATDPIGADAAALLVEVGQIADVSRAQILADPDFVPVPTGDVLLASQIAAQVQQIDPLHAAPGDPATAPQPPWLGATSVAIVDADGNAAAISASLGGAFGAGLFVHGFMLNAALTDFAPAASDSANRVQPGKRPATTLAPALILDGAARLTGVLGSSGGLAVPSYEAQAAVGLLAWGMAPDAALALPHAAGWAGTATLEADTTAAPLASALAERGFQVTVAAMPSGTALIVIAADGPAGAADPRGHGAVAQDGVLPPPAEIPQ